MGTRDAPTGIRALHRRGDELHAITGSLDAQDKGSALLEDHPEVLGPRARTTASR